MDHLPTDLLREIFDLLDPNWDDYSSPNHWVRSPRSYYKHPENRRDLSDLARLRLVCKRFSSLGAQYLFRCVVQRFNRRSFRRLECLAEHPELGRHVKKFVYLMPYLYVQGTYYISPHCHPFAYLHMPCLPKLEKEKEAWESVKTKDPRRQARLSKVTPRHLNW